MTGRPYERLVIGYLMAVILAQIIFAARPQIDLAVSHAFATGTAGFGWADGLAATINLILRRCGEAAALLLVVGCAFGGVTGRLRRDDLRAWGYLALCVLTSTGVVNLIFKAHVGRTRPDSLAEFGGVAQFSPPWQMVEECSRNCSFTSGEVALAAGLAIPALVLLWPRLRSRRSQVLAVALGVGYVAVVGLLRIGLGRHFLSDAVFSALFAGAAALAFYPVLRIEEARQRISPPDLIALAQGWIVERRARGSGLRKRAS